MNLSVIMKSLMSLPLLITAKPANLVKLAAVVSKFSLSLCFEITATSPNKLFVKDIARRILFCKVRFDRQPRS